MNELILTQTIDEDTEVRVYAQESNIIAAIYQRQPVPESPDGGYWKRITNRHTEQTVVHAVRNAKREYKSIMLKRSL